MVDYAINSEGEFDGGQMLKSAIAGAASGATSGFILGITKGTGKRRRAMRRLRYTQLLQKFGIMQTEAKN